MRQKTHQSSWELPAVRQPVNKVSIKYTFFKIMLCIPSLGKIFFFWLNFCMVKSAYKEHSLKNFDRSFCVSTSIFSNLTYRFKKTFLYTCVSPNFSPVTRSSVGVILLEKKQLCGFYRTALRDEQQRQDPQLNMVTNKIKHSF